MADENLMRNSVAEGQYGFRSYSAQTIWENTYVVLNQLERNQAFNIYSPQQYLNKDGIIKLSQHLVKLRDAVQSHERLLAPNVDFSNEKEVITFFTTLFNFQSITTTEQAQGYIKDAGEYFYNRYGTIFSTTSRDENSLANIIKRATQKTYQNLDDIFNVKHTFEQYFAYEFLKAAGQLTDSTKNIRFEDISHLLPSLINQGGALKNALSSKEDFEKFYRDVMQRKGRKIDKKQPLKLLQTKKGKNAQNVINGAIFELADTIISGTDILPKGAKIHAIRNTGAQQREIVDLGFVEQVFDIQTKTVSEYSRVSDEVNQKADGTIVISIPHMGSKKYVKLRISNKFRSFRDDKTNHVVQLQKSKFYTAIPQLAKLVDKTDAIEGLNNFVNYLAFWILNASTGAIFENQREIIEQIVHNLIITFMFDDLEQVLDDKNNDVLVFEINENVVPASVILTRMINFVQNAIITTKIYYPDAQNIYDELLAKKDEEWGDVSNRANLLRNTVATTGQISGTIAKTKWDAIFT